MPKRRRKATSLKKRRVAPKSSRFLPDRILGFCTAVGPVLGLVAALALGGLATANTVLQKRRPAEMHSTAFLAAVLLAVALFFVLSIAISVMVARGRRVGFLLFGGLAGLSIGLSLYGTSHGWPVKVSWWPAIFLGYSFLRLGGFGPKPT